MSASLTQVSSFLSALPRNMLWLTDNSESSYFRLVCIAGTMVAMLLPNVFAMVSLAGLARHIRHGHHIDLAVRYRFVRHVHTLLWWLGSFIPFVFFDWPNWLFERTDIADLQFNTLMALGPMALSWLISRLIFATFNRFLQQYSREDTRIETTAKSLHAHFLSNHGLLLIPITAVVFVVSLVSIAKIANGSDELCFLVGLACVGLLPVTMPLMLMPWCRRLHVTANTTKRSIPVYELPVTRHRTACFVTGICHPWQAVFLSQKLVRCADQVQLNSLLEHEIAHIRLLHPLHVGVRLTTLLLGFAATSVLDGSHEPSIRLAIAQCLLLAIWLTLNIHWQWRHEFDADWRACHQLARTTQRPFSQAVHTYADTLRWLSQTDPDANAASWSHPSLDRRIMRLQARISCLTPCEVMFFGRPTRKF